MKYYKNSKNKYVYVKQYKAGSSSIDEYTKDHRLCGFDATPEELQTKYKDWFKFGVVRNPYDRVVSVYVDKCVENPVNRINRGDETLQTCQRIILKALNKPLKLEEFSKITFEQFVEILPEIYNNDWHFYTQSPFLVNSSNTVVVDKLARFENFDTEVKDILNELGFTITEMPHKNKTSRASYRDYYNEKTKKIVTEIYKDDLKNFGYEF